MSRLSLLSKLNILFSFGVVVITVGAYLIYNRLEYRDNYFTGLRFEKAAQIVREAHQNKQPFPIHELKLMDLELIKDLKSVKEKKKVISIPIPKYYIGVFNTNKGQEYAIKSENQNIYLKDNRIPDKTKELLFAGFIFSIVMLFLFYISIFRSISPIKALEKKVKLFGEGDFGVDCSSDRKDEIGNLANSFDSSIKRLKELMDARMLFLRNAAHELKTPLTKGMIALELPDGEKKSKSLKGVFIRLNTLIGELLNIEKITSGNLKLILEEKRLIDIIFNVEALLFLEKNTLSHNIKNERVKVDWSLYSLAIKNLVDNGIKYSKNSKVTIEIKNGYFYVINQGEKLNKPLEYYLEPFSKDNTNQQGFGLGLFIVNHIFKAHNSKLRYIHENGCSKFYFKF